MKLPRSGMFLMTVLTLVACGSSDDVATAGRLALAIDSAETVDDGKRCALAVTARNDLGTGALNLQVAWMAQTEGFGIISDYQMFGDFEAGESRALRLSIVGAPCDAVRSLKLTRAVCVVAPAQEPSESCADRVQLEGGGILTVERRDTER